MANRRKTSEVTTLHELKLGDLVRCKSCFYEKFHGSPEYGVVVDIEYYDTVRTKGVKVLWAPHKKAHDYDEYYAYATWKLSNLIERVK